MKVNSFGSVLTVSTFLSDLIETQGRVIQISSISVKLPSIFQAYPSSKIAMEALCIYMRQELKLLGVDMILIRAGAVNTALLKEMYSLPVPAEKSKYARYYARFVNNAKNSVGKMIEPAQVAALVGKALKSASPNNIYTINRNRTNSIFSKFPPKVIDNLILKTVR